MIVIMKQDASADDVDGVVRLIRQAGLGPQLAQGAEQNVVAVLGSPDTARSDGAQSLTFENFSVMMEQVRALSGVVAGMARPIGANP